jgi:hypothetical protein
MITEEGYYVQETQVVLAIRLEEEKNTKER